MKKPTQKEIQKARKKVEDLFADTHWYHTLDEWQGSGWDKYSLLAGLLVGMRISEDRKILVGERECTRRAGN